MFAISRPADVRLRICAVFHAPRAGSARDITDASGMAVGIACPRLFFIKLARRL
jgi:hypothetical protein